MIVVDTETYPADDLPEKWGLKRPYVRLIAIAGKDSVSVYDLKQLNEEETRKLIEKILEKGIIGHNLSFDLKALWRTLGRVKLPSSVWDTMMHEFFVHPKYREHKFFSLQAVAYRRLREVISKEEQRSDWKGELTESQIEYAEKDAEVTRDVYLKQRKDLYSVRAIGRRRIVRKKKFLGKEYPAGYALVHEVVPFVALLEYHGIPFDVEMAKEIKEEIEKDVNELELKIKALTGTKKVEGKEFREAFKRMGYGEVNSLSQEEIEKVWHKLSPRQKIAYLLRKEMITKKKEVAFIKQSLQYEINGRIYPEWRQLTKTGRIVSRAPNVQNVPKKSRVKELIKVPAGYTFVSVDFPQIEIRIAARWIEYGLKEAKYLFPFLDVEGGLTFALKKGEDIHRITAAVIFGKSPEEIDELERKVGKVVNFSFLYGGKEALRTSLLDSFPELSEQIDDRLLEEITRSFYEVYPDIEFFHKVMNQTKKEFYALGGTPIFPFKKTDALNYPIQASGAEILKDVAIEVLKRRKEDIEAEKIKPIMVIHDELVFEVEKSLAESFSRELEEIVKNSIEFFTGTRPKDDLVVIKETL